MGFHNGTPNNTGSFPSTEQGVFIRVAWMPLKSASGFILFNGMLLTRKVIRRAISKLGNH